MPSGPITRARAKKIQKAMNALVKKFLGLDMGFKGRRCVRRIKIGQSLCLVSITLPSLADLS